ncbi:hypothetical protein HYPSUDRAFT_441261 [Hypholoma sublateritium FD-334 SS-4]|uniref:Uncharacterized protein n=1 Tax=Hypholoma sublateritium (strain FD-334 SS-4) TaxID=945553 RepID=A0A0D2P9H2_HYPSF|nr:hypothetical protein HYPSUDRAFT_441261 [Hypholoma sublateritium FD-334 SS-4]
MRVRVHAYWPQHAEYHPNPRAVPFPRPPPGRARLCLPGAAVCVRSHEAHSSLVESSKSAFPCAWRLRETVRVRICSASKHTAQSRRIAWRYTVYVQYKIRARLSSNRRENCYKYQLIAHPRVHALAHRRFIVVDTPTRRTFDTQYPLAAAPVITPSPHAHQLAAQPGSHAALRIP